MPIANRKRSEREPLHFFGVRAGRPTGRSRKGASMEKLFVPAQPYPWPYDGTLRSDNTALLVVDMQTDFCGVGGFLERMGGDINLTRVAIEPIRAVLTLFRERDFLVVHTREGHRPDLSDLPANKRWR